METTGNKAAGQDGISAGNAGIGAPNNPTEYWSAGVLGRWSNLATHQHVRRSLGEGGATPISVVLSAFGPSKEEASVKPDPPPQP